MLIAPPIIGTLPAAATAAATVNNGQPPFTVQLDSTNAARAISVSADGGVTFVVLTPIATAANALLVNYNGPVSQFGFAGAAGDKYQIM